MWQVVLQKGRDVHCEVDIALRAHHAQLLSGIYVPGQQANGRTFGSAGGTGWGGAM